MRTPLIAGNWKMHLSLDEAAALATAVAGVAAACDDREVMIAPPFTALARVREVAGERLMLAGQNVCWEDKGAFTGEIAPPMLRELGCRMAIVGHSERRHVFGEDDAMVNRRLRGAQAHGLIPILCIGETLEEREAGQTMAVLERQMRAGLEQVAVDDPARLVIAYEPVWAIGTGKTASPAQAQEAHEFVRRLLAEVYEKNIAAGIRILYGGSVNAANVDEIMAQADVDGALVGGASLSAETFERIIRFV
ncbi:triose-phosphate isomerase [Desulfurivibrio dismutans]|uniref:triose-phosphate isomerase n=1 Tax=Desulfurivibrio dismutans TaxID=1398908 RepID=UPI0023DC7D43|nr:triose-phosphate isomerase [Desulfurivibrio alkaliphilus]MDF1614182.1 triose-phosphate isomerase [Desulfurivibrio alkaliphilus]